MVRSQSTTMKMRNRNGRTHAAFSSLLTIPGPSGSATPLLPAFEVIYCKQINPLDNYCPPPALSGDWCEMSPRRNGTGRSGGMMCRRPQLGRLFPGKRGRRLSCQRGQHQGNHMLEPLIPRLLAQEVAAKDDAEGRAIGEVEKAEPGDGNIKLHRIDGDAKIAGLDAAPHHVADHLDERRMHRLHLCGALEVLRFREILDIEQRQELGVADKVVPGEFDQTLDRLGRSEML